MPDQANNEVEENQLGRMAEFYAVKLASTNLSVAERRLAAQRLRPLVSAILTPGALPEENDWPERLYRIVECISQGILAMLELEEQVIFTELKAKLDVACDLIAALDEFASSDAIELEDKVFVVKAAGTLVNPALRIAVRLIDPDRVEYGYVGDAAVRLGSTAMSIAWRASAIAEDKGRELRRAGITIH